MRRVYIAGALNAMSVDYIKNMHKMMTCANEVKKAGFAVYVPCIDILMGLKFGDYEYADYFNNSQPFLDVCEAVFVTPGWENSDGTKRELSRAGFLGIPIFHDVPSLVAWEKEANNDRSMEGPI